MADFNNFEDILLADNPDPRGPVVLVLDCSSSMVEARPGETTTPLDALNSGLDTLVTELNRDPLAKRRVEISIVTFGTDVTPATDFATIDNLILPTLSPSGTTSTGKAIIEALDALEARKKVYKANGVQYYRAMVLLITDGLATDDTSEAIARVKAAEASKSISFFSIGVDGADLESLSKFSEKGALKLKGMQFDELFQWVSASQSAVSASNPGEGVKLPPPGWMEF